MDVVAARPDRDRPAEGPAGLSQLEARRRLEIEGPNELVPPPRRVSRTLSWIVKAVTDPMALLLLVAAPTYWLLGNRLDAIVTAVALVPITAVSVALEIRAERTLEALARLTSPRAMVVRDGTNGIVAAREVVRGDRMDAAPSSWARQARAPGMGRSRASSRVRRNRRPPSSGSPRGS